ncbi:DNA-3-methyladenine glycosylase [candidate division KSB1 bacterium]|nr:DNA-3-methyladenine glycosylase [candidate division KSB1 bacterium]
MVLPRNFYCQDSATVARHLLGKRLVRLVDGVLLAGFIREVEAYFGENDSASHAAKGKTSRNAIMFGPAGYSYVYFIYGMHFMFNIVTEEEGCAGAVLIRSVFPTHGLATMRQFRNGNKKHLADGPAKLCQALRIDARLNHIDLTKQEKIWLEEGVLIDQTSIHMGSRIGIHYALVKDQRALLRFWLN